MSLETLIERVVAESDREQVEAARLEFMRRTGDFAPEDSFYEERLRAAFESAVLTWGRPRGVLAQRWSRRSPEDGAVLAALCRGWRSVFAVLSEGSRIRVRGLLGGAELDVVSDRGAGERLRAGDLFVGRLFIDRGVCLGPGAIFFERDVHAAIAEVVRRAAEHGRRSDATADALLRMQMRRLRQPALRPLHAFRWDAFEELAIRAAPWARRR